MKQGHRGQPQGRKKKHLAPITFQVYQWVTGIWDQLFAFINKKIINRLGQEWVLLWVQYHSYSLWKVMFLLATWSLWIRI
jgi:hypothetical protein